MRLFFLIHVVHQHHLQQQQLQLWIFSFSTQARLVLDSIFSAYDKLRSEISRSRDRERRLLTFAVDILNAVNDIRILSSSRPDVIQFNGDGIVDASSMWKDEEFYDASSAFQKTNRLLLLLLLVVVVVVVVVLLVVVLL